MEEKKSFDSLVLSGGSVRGFIMLGALQYLVDKNLLKDTKRYVGVSVGSIIGYLLSIGYTPVEMLVYISINNVLSNMASWNIQNVLTGNGAINFTPIHEILEKMTIDKIGKLITLRELKDEFGVDLVCIAFNLTKNKKEYISYETFPTMPCITALRLSSNLPLIFGHFKYMGSFYIDGAITDNFPIEYECGISYRPIGINIGIADTTTTTKIDSLNLLEYVYKVLSIPITEKLKASVDKVKEKCKIITLTPETNKNVFEFNVSVSERLEMFSSGYTKCKEYFENEIN